MLFRSVRIYTTQICGYCIAAKRFMDHHNITFEEIDVSADDEMRRWLVERTGQRTVPQIFIGERSIGGYTDLRALDARGELAPLLNG